jgi:hypothetical protein
MVKLNPLHPESSIYLADHFRFDKLMDKTAGVRWDGSHADLMRYLHRLEKLFEPITTMSSYYGVETTVRLAPLHLQMGLTSYRIREHAQSPIYILDHEVCAALDQTNLTWIDAQSFAHLPQCFSIVVSEPSDKLTLFHTEADGKECWLPVSDYIVWRIHDPDQRARLAESHNILNSDDPSIQMFAWVGTSRQDYVNGSTASNWGSFVIGDNVKLDDLSRGLEATMKRVAEMAIAQGEMPRLVVPEDASDDYREFLARQDIENKGFLEDFRHSDAQGASLVVSSAFIAKFVLLHSCEWFKGHCVPLHPPGLKAMPHKAVMMKLAWGNRLKVVLPPCEMSQDDELTDHERKSPSRHWVPGFFRQQPYGPNRTLRRTQWIRSFWRGSTPIMRG